MANAGIVPTVRMMIAINLLRAYFKLATTSVLFSGISTNAPVSTK
jgi:hypothetical protein